MQDVKNAVKLIEEENPDVILMDIQLQDGITFNSLELNCENLVPPGEEMEVLNKYLSLQQMYFEDAFTYEVIRQKGEDTCEIMIPPMLVQPYVENDIYTG